MAVGERAPVNYCLVPSPSQIALLFYLTLGLIAVLGADRTGLPAIGAPAGLASMCWNASGTDRDAPAVAPVVETTGVSISAWDHGNAEW